MNGGEISGNTASRGGGVYTSNYYAECSFTMEGGAISGNIAGSSGGGVYVGRIFTMNGGEISGNTTSGRGGGVYVDSTFTMSGGEISGNTSSSGGGVYVGGIFTMSGGEISGNLVNTSFPDNSYYYYNYGGGVHIGGYGRFTKTGGTIYGYSTSDTVNSNVVKRSGTVQSDRGHGIYAGRDSSPTLTKRMETTAGPEAYLYFYWYGDSSIPPEWTGDWDF